MDTFISHSASDTESFGRFLAGLAKPGWVVGLSGDLGAGKTQWVKGFARGLGIEDRVQSPTFALVHEYAGGRLPLAHLDLYRLPDADAVVASGLVEYLDPREGVSVIEWFERWTGPDPRRLARVVIRRTDGSTEDTGRCIDYELPRD